MDGQTDGPDLDFTCQPCQWPLVVYFSVSEETARVASAGWKVVNSCTGVSKAAMFCRVLILNWMKEAWGPCTSSLSGYNLTFSEHLQEDNLPSSPPLPFHSQSVRLPTSYLDRFPLYRLPIGKSVWLMYYWNQANLICLIEEWLQDAHMVVDKDRMRRGGGVGGGRQDEGIIFLGWSSTQVARDENRWLWETVWFEATHGCLGDMNALIPFWKFIFEVLAYCML